MYVAWAQYSYTYIQLSQYEDAKKDPVCTQWYHYLAEHKNGDAL